LTDGRLVAVWQSGTGADRNIAGQIFNADGTKSGVEFAVNGTLTDPQGEARISSLANGGFLVTWSSGVATDKNIVGRVYGADGIGGAEFAVNTTVTNNQVTSDSVQLADGRLMIVWSSNDGANYDIRGRMMNADGSADNADFLVSSTTANGQGEPEVKLMADGRVMIAWDSFDNGTDFNIRTAIVNPLIFYGTSGVDAWKGGVAAERLYGDAGADALDGGAGDDAIYGGNDIDTIHGGDGNDLISGDAGDDILFGDAGNDRMYGGAGNDQFNGGLGDDIMYGSVGNDTYIGGAGLKDTLSFYYGAAVVVNLTTNVFGGAATGDALGTGSAIEYLFGSLTGNDNLTGNSADNVIYGYGGDDVIDGGTYNDYLDGGLGADTIEGGSGNDKIYGRDGADIITAGVGTDIVYGGAGGDNMDGGTGTDTLSYYYETLGATVSLGGTVTVGGSATGDVIAANTFEYLAGSNVGNDSLTGSSVANRLFGYNGNDTLYGLAGDDKLEGGNGNDTLYGGAGADGLIGGFGDDLFVGGDGVDTISSESGYDIIRFNALSEIGDKMTTFNAAFDQIQLEGSVFGGLAAAATVAANRVEINLTGAATALATRFIYETDQRKLWYDADGSNSAAAVVIIDFTTATSGGAFSYADITII
jgi:Ca2+-binding RTX toxin-like protein